MTIIDDMYSMLEQLQTAESDRFWPYLETQELLNRLVISPAEMRAPLVLSRGMADLFIQAGMHPDDIVVSSNIFCPIQRPSVLLGGCVRKGKGQRKSGRTQRWGRGAIR